MIKKLTKHGNSMALVIEKPVLELLGASNETSFEVTTDGKSLILTPVNDVERQSRFRKSLETIGERYAKSFEELAK